MKKIFVSILFILAGFYSFSQEYKRNIEKQFFEYLGAIISKDFNKSLEYVNEDFLNVVPKSQLINVLETTFNNPEIEFKFDSLKILKIDEIRKFNNINYVKMNYGSIMYMKFNIAELNSDTISVEDKKTMRNLLTAGMEKQFGQENVKYDDATQFYRLYSVKNVIANSKDTKTWKFVVIEENLKPILEKFIPKELLVE